MNSNKILYLMMGGILLTLVIGLRLRSPVATAPPAPAGQPSAAVEPDSDTPRQRPAVQRKADRSADAKPAARQSVAVPAQAPVGVEPPPAAQRLMVEWQGRWYPAEIIASSNNQHYVHYVGYGPEWDEWVTSNRLDLSSEAQAKSAPITESTDVLAPRELNTGDLIAPTTPLVQGAPKEGDLLVEWNKQWWPAEIMQTDGDKFLIHYTGYGTNWDEWVPMERLTTYSNQGANNR